MEGRQRSTGVGAPPSDDAIAFVYRHALGRDATDGDIQIWVDNLRGGFPFQQFVLDMLSSEEGRQRPQALDGRQMQKAITFVYRHALGREPYPADVQQWSEYLRGGLPFEQFLIDVTESAEAEAHALASRGGRSLSGGDDVPHLTEQSRRIPSVASVAYAIPDIAKARPRVERSEPGRVESAIAFVYRNALGREPSDADRVLWSKHLEEGLSFPRFLEEVTTSAEGRQRSSVVDAGPSRDAISFVYRHALGREASDEDMRIWVDHLRGGVPFQQFVLDILSSDEARQRPRALDEPQMRKALTFVYNHALGRKPSSADLQQWLEHLRGGLLFERFLLDIAESKEAEAHASASLATRGLSDGLFVAHLYELCLARCALPSEIEHWKRRFVEHEYSRSDVAMWFVESAILEEQRLAKEGLNNDPGSVSVMGTHRHLNAAIWGERAIEIENGLNLGQPSALSAPYVIRQHTIRVSAIASLYKGGRYIRKFLDNMTQQSLGENFELIIIDADSPDGEYDVIKDYQKIWPNIRYERMNYRIGIYDAWNVAVGLARGDYLTNTNLDDLRRRDSLEIQAETLDAVPFADVVYQDFFYSLDPELTFDQVEVFGFKTLLPIVTANNLLAYNSPHNAPMWRKRLHADVGLFDTSLKSAGDHEFWLRCLERGKVFYKINTPHVVYYQNPDGISTRPGTLGVTEGQRIQRKYGRRLISPDVYLDRDGLATKLQALGVEGAIASDDGTTYAAIQRLILSLASAPDRHSVDETLP